MSTDEVNPGATPAPSKAVQRLMHKRAKRHGAALRSTPSGHSPLAEELGRMKDLAPGDRFLRLRDMLAGYGISQRGRHNVQVIIGELERALLEVAAPHHRVEVLRAFIDLSDKGVTGDDLRLQLGAMAMGRKVTRAEVGLAPQVGDACGRDGCEGVLELEPVENCACHITAPCAACENQRLACAKCREPVA